MSVNALALLAIVFSVHATEVDDTRLYSGPLEDSEPILNAQVERWLDEAVAAQPDCNVKTFTEVVGRALTGNLFFGRLEQFANSSPRIMKSHPAVEQSIYRNTPFARSLVGRLVGLGPVVNMGGHLVGTDKIGHFFDQGYTLYSLWVKGAQVTQLIRESAAEETGFFGLLMTGVKSHADIASNFDGWRFWVDLLSDGERGFLRCQEGRLKRVRSFRFNEYMTAAWSEAVNCSTFRDDFPERAIMCPLTPEVCPQLRQMYARWVPAMLLDEVVSPACR